MPAAWILNSSIKSPITDREIADSSPLALVLVGTDRVLSDRNGVVGKAVFVQAVAKGIAELFVGRTIAFDRAFVRVGIVHELHRHRRHSASFVPERLR